MCAKEKISRRQFRRVINALCRKWRIPEYSDYFCARYWPSFSRLEDAGQRAFWHVLGAKEVDMLPHIAIFVRGGVVQGVASNTPNVLIKLINIDLTVRSFQKQFSRFT